MTSETSQTPGEPVVVPWTQVPAATLRTLIESFVLREGTDYGAQEYTLEQKVAHVAEQLERGEAFIVFDPHTQSVTILTHVHVPVSG